MIEYIKNIIPRIQRYSKDLSKIENFIDKNWIFIDENGNYHEYLFLRDKRLIMTLGSTTKEGSWELLPTGQLLITRGTNDLVKLENMFVENALLVLKRSATDDTPFVLINQQLIPDLDAVKYLERFEYEKTIIKIPPSQQKYRLLSNGEIVAPEIYIGKQIKTFDDVILFGVYKVANNNIGKHILIVDNIVKRIFYRVKYVYKGHDILIEQDFYNDPQIGNILFERDHNKIPNNQWINITDSNQLKKKVFFDKNYKIIKVENEERIVWIILISILLLLFLLLYLRSFF